MRNNERNYTPLATAEPHWAEVSGSVTRDLKLEMNIEDEPVEESDRMKQNLKPKMRDLKLEMSIEDEPVEESECMRRGLKPKMNAERGLANEVESVKKDLNAEMIVERRYLAADKGEHHVRDEKIASAESSHESDRCASAEESENAEKDLKLEMSASYNAAMESGSEKRDLKLEMNAECNHSLITIDEQGDRKEGETSATLSH